MVVNLGIEPGTHFQSIVLPSELRYRAVVGANIESFFYPKHFFKKINSYLRPIKLSYDFFIDVETLN
jgi:hypothetical protein